MHNSASKTFAIAPILPKGGIRLDPPLAMLPIFSPLAPNAQRIMQECSVRYHGTIITAHYPQLSQRDQSLLLGLLSIASKTGQVSQAETGDGLQAEGKILMWKTVDVHTSMHDLIRAAGWTQKHVGKRTYKALHSTLIRLHQVVISAELQGDVDHLKTYCTNLISAHQEEKGGQLTIRLCGRVASALLGMHHIRLLMTERQNLKTPTAEIMHAWLSGWCRGSGKKAMRISVEKLATHIWRAGELTKKRLASIRSAIQEINGLNAWDIQTMSGRGAGQIIRVHRA